MVRIVRYLIDDYAEPYTYTDARLEELIIVSAQLIVYSIDFDKDYTIDVDSCTISPDPTDSVREDAFINLVSLKAACILFNAEAKAKAATAISVKDGLSTIDMSGAYKSLQERAKTACDNFSHARLEYVMGNSRAGEAIIGPYTIETNIPYPGNFS